jgi:PAS domain S-box-containing protein
VKPRKKPTDPSPASRGASFYLENLGTALGARPISLEALIDAIPDAILFVDVERRIRFWNRGAELTFGYTPEEVTGAYYDLLLPPDLKQSGELETLEKITTEKGYIRNHLTRRVTKDGRERIISLSRATLRDHAGAIVGVTAILRDVTDQVRVEQELSRARSLAMLGELAATVAHEIKNPLAGIHGAAQILLKEFVSVDPRREILERMETQIRRLDATIRDLLRFSKPETPRLENRDVRELVESLADAIAEDPRFLNITFHASGESALRADCDERLLIQLFQNLLENAHDALEGRGTIEMDFRVEGEFAVVRIRDTGPGVAEASRERIFDPFFTTKSRGTGLGLAICRKNAEAHGGTISVENHPAGGAVFIVKIPMHRRAFLPDADRNR